jgi:hypothetical protein
MRQLLSVCDDRGIARARQDQNQSQNRRTCITGLVRNSEDHTSYNKMHKRSRFPICELEKSDNQADKTGYRDNIKKSGHLEVKSICSEQTGVNATSFSSRESDHFAGS